MTPETITYLTFGGLLILALIFDLGLLSKKHTHITIRKALWQTIFWVSLALAFFVFVWIEFNRTIALEYLSAYLTEWSLSIDNIFVFILIFSFFAVKDDQYARVLLIGIMMAVIFRVIFITIGIVLVERFEWLLYIFGAILVYTGIKNVCVKRRRSSYSRRKPSVSDHKKNTATNTHRQQWKIYTQDKWQTVLYLDLCGGTHAGIYRYYFCA